MLIIYFLFACYFAFLEDNDNFGILQFGVSSNYLVVRFCIRFFRFIVVYHLLVVLMAPITLYVITAVVFFNSFNYWTKTMLIQTDYNVKLMKKYMECQVQMVIINDYTRWVAPICLVVCPSWQIISIYTTIRLSHQISMPAFLIFTVFVIVITVTEFLVVPTAAQMHTNSSEFLWKCQQNSKRWVRKFGKGCKAIHMALGSFGFVDVGFVITFFTMIIDTTINLLLSTK